MYRYFILRAESDKIVLKKNIHHKNFEQTSKDTEIIITVKRTEFLNWSQKESFLMNEEKKQTVTKPTQDKKKQRRIS